MTDTVARMSGGEGIRGKCRAEHSGGQQDRPITDDRLPFEVSNEMHRDYLSAFVGSRVKVVAVASCASKISLT